MMIFPPLPTVGETPWHAKRAAWDAAVESGLNAAQSTANTAQAGVSAAAAREYWGPGRPDVAGSLNSAGTAWVAAATAGAVFHSTDGPQGAWTWQRRGSTWACVEGDTGWVTMPVSVTGASGAIRLNRTAIRVEYLFPAASGLTLTGASGVVIPLPVGFRPLAETFALWGVDAPSKLMSIGGASLTLWGSATGNARCAGADTVAAPAWPLTLTV